LTVDIGPYSSSVYNTIYTQPTILYELIYTCRQAGHKGQQPKEMDDIASSPDPFVIVVTKRWGFVNAGLQTKNSTLVGWMMNERTTITSLFTSFSSSPIRWEPFPEMMAPDIYESEEKNGKKVSENDGRRRIVLGVGRQISVLWVLSVRRNRLHYTCIKDMEMPVVLYLTIPCVV
jgi:hypothetical protein